MTDLSPTDTQGQLHAVERLLTRRAGDGTISTVVSLSQSYATDVDDLWDACTTPERLARWFAPVSGDLRLGGRYRIEGNASGAIEACDPPRTFTVTWEYGGELSHVDVGLEPDGADRARLTITHRAATDPDRWSEYGPGAVGVGWDLTLLGLALHLARGGDTLAEGMAWMASADARRFMAEASRRWADQAVVAGTPEPEAGAAEARTTAFYLGEEPADAGADAAEPSKSNPG